MGLLHSQAYLQAVLRFAAHIQALAEKEHQRLGKSAMPETHQVLQCNAAAGVSTATYQGMLALCTAAGSAPPCTILDDSIAEGACAGAQAFEDRMATAALLCSAQAKMLEAALRVVLHRQKLDTRPVVSQASRYNTEYKIDLLSLCLLTKLSAVCTVCG